MAKKKPQPKPPPVLGCSRVLHYAVVDKTVGFVGRTLLFVGTKELKELGRVPCLAICEDRGTGVLLFHCSRNWKTLGCSAHDSVDAARKKAEGIYPGLSTHWKAAHVTKKRARQFLNKLWGNLRCAFCAKQPHEVRQLFGKSGAHICDMCLEKYHGMLKKPVEAGESA
jgi:hypothetical protein